MNFFPADKQQRLVELMKRWRAARDREEPLIDAEQRELELLIMAELVAAGERAAALCHDDLEKSQIRK